MNLSKKIGYARKDIFIIIQGILLKGRCFETAFYTKCARISSMMWWSSNLIDCSWWVLPNRYWADYGFSFQAFTQCGILSHYIINDFPVVSQGIIVFVVFIPLSYRFDIEILEW